MVRCFNPRYRAMEHLPNDKYEREKEGKNTAATSGCVIRKHCKNSLMRACLKIKGRPTTVQGAEGHVSTI